MLFSLPKHFPLSHFNKIHDFHCHFALLTLPTVNAILLSIFIQLLTWLPQPRVTKATQAKQNQT